MLDIREGITAHFFNPQNLRILVQSSGSGALRRINSDAARATGAEAILDGSMYSDIGGGLARPRFLMIDSANGVNIQSRQSTDGMTISVIGNVAYPRRGASALQGASVAVQLYPEILRGGQNVTNPARDADTDWRAALGIRHDGMLGFAVGIASMFTFARRLRDLGFVDAGYTDGGDSTFLSNRQGQWAGAHNHRAVASWLLDIGDYRTVPNNSGLRSLMLAFGAWAAYQAWK